MNIDNIEALQSAKAVDRDGDRLGDVGQVYVSDDGRQPLFVTVKTGFFGTNESFVPLEGADLQDGVLHLGYDRDTIKDAPNIANDGHLSDDEQGTIFDYYDGRAGGVPSGVGGAPAGLPDEADGPQDAGTAGLSAGTTTGGAGDGYDTSGPTTDDAMTRSEEQLRVGVQQVETGRVRLRKYVVTEQQTVTVPVTHEEVRLEREPITDENRSRMRTVAMP